MDVSEGHMTMQNNKIQLRIPFTDEELLRVGQAMGKIGQTDIGDYARNAIVGFAEMVVDKAEKTKHTPEPASTKK